MRNFRKLEIWNLGMELILDVYEIIDFLPEKEKFNLCHQLRKSVISMPSNIAEGASRNSNKEFVRFLEIALGSSFELETQLLACIKIGYFEESQLNPIIEKLNIFQRKTNTFRSRLLE